MDDKWDNSWKLIFDKLNNNLSEEETAEFNKWLESDSENEMLFNNISRFSEEEERFSKYDSIDQLKAWKKVKKSITPPKKSTRIYLSIVKYAAVFLLGMFAFYGLNHGFKNSLTTENLQKYHTIYAPKGSKAELKLSDGTSIILNGGSQLTYPEIFDGDRRDVKLIGEAYFDVARDVNRPFHIKTNELNIKVLGTSFNVKSYPEDKAVETYVTSGKVEIELSGRYKKKIYLTKDEKAVYIKSAEEIRTEHNIEKSAENTVSAIKDTKKDVTLVESTLPELRIARVKNPEETISWKEDKFIFSNEPLESLIKKLERWYGVDIELKMSKLEQLHFTGIFEQETIEEVMNILAYSIPIEWKKSHKKIVIKSRN